MVLSENPGLMCPVNFARKFLHFHMVGSVKMGITEDSEVLLSWLHLGKKNNAHSTPLVHALHPPDPLGA